MRDLGTLGGPEQISVAMGINEWGQIVGSSAKPEEDSRAFLWSPVTGRMRDLGVLDETNQSASASAINNLGQVVGSSFSHGGEHAFLWSPITRRMRDLGTLGTDHSYAEAINDLGQVAGYSSTQRLHRLLTPSSGHAGRCKISVRWAATTATRTR